MISVIVERDGTDHSIFDVIFVQITDDPSKRVVYHSITMKKSEPLGVRIRRRRDQRLEIHCHSITQYTEKLPSAPCTSATSRRSRRPCSRSCRSRPSIFRRIFSGSRKNCCRTSLRVWPRHIRSANSPAGRPHGLCGWPPRNAQLPETLKFSATNTIFCFKVTFDRHPQRIEDRRPLGCALFRRVNRLAGGDARECQRKYQKQESSG